MIGVRVTPQCGQKVWYKVASVGQMEPLASLKIISTPPECEMPLIESDSWNLGGVDFNLLYYFENPDDGGIALGYGSCYDKTYGWNSRGNKLRHCAFYR